MLVSMVSFVWVVIRVVVVVLVAGVMVVVVVVSAVILWYIVCGLRFVLWRGTAYPNLVSAFLFLLYSSRLGSVAPSVVLGFPGDVSDCGARQSLCSRTNEGGKLRFG